MEVNAVKRFPTANFRSNMKELLAKAGKPVASEIQTGHPPGRLDPAKGRMQPEASRSIYGELLIQADCVPF